MYEWMYEWMNEWIDEWMNECSIGRMNEWLDEWLSKSLRIKNVINEWKTSKTLLNIFKHY